MLSQLFDRLRLFADLNCTTLSIRINVLPSRSRSSVGRDYVENLPNLRGFTAMDDDRIHELIGIIYDAALDPRHWTTVVDQLKSATKSHQGHLWSGTIHDDVRTLLSERDQYLAFEHDGFSFDEFKAVSDRIGPDARLTDPHLDRAHQAPEGKASLGRELVPLDDLRASDYYNEFGRRFDNFHMLGSVMIRNKKAVSALGFFRSERDALYGDNEKRLLDLFLPHIRRSLNLSGHLQLTDTRARVLQSSLDALRSAIFLIDETGKIVFFNAAADRLLKQSPELYVKNDRLHARTHAATVRLEHLNRCATGAEGQRPIGGAVVIERVNAGSPLQVVAAPLSPNGQSLLKNGADAVALVVIHDPSVQIAVPQEIIGAMFGLTPTEAHLLLALSEGQTLRQYSDEHQVTYNTVRTHLRSVFAKTNTSKQSDLVRLLSGLTHSLALSERQDGICHGK